MTKLSPPIPEGAVLLITEDGTMIEILHDTFDIFSHKPDNGSSFINFLKSDSVEKGCLFIENITSNGVAYDWELHVKKKQNYPWLFYFSGVKLEKEILLIGSVDSDNTSQFMNGLMEINNKQMNKLRLLMKKRQKVSLKEIEWTLYDDMSELNNELANTQRKLTKKTAELERTNELKNQMMGMAAHDLRNPLNVILNFAEFLIDDHKEKAIFTEDQYQMITQIKKSSAYMVQIIEDMLDISSFDSGSVKLKKKNYNLVDLIEEAASLSRSQAKKKNIVITTILPESPVYKEIDAHKFQQVLDNLLSNAVKYSNSDTEIEVGINPEDKSERVAIFVKDQGQGIPKDEMDKLFDPFSQVSVKTTAGEQSTGLGLAIVKKIVEAHGGKIEVESTVGAGSTFTIKIP